MKAAGLTIQKRGKNSSGDCALPIGKLHMQEVLELDTHPAPALLQSCAERKMLCLRQAQSLGAKTLF